MPWTKGKIVKHKQNVDESCQLIYTSLFAQIAATKQIKQHTKLTNSYDKSKNLLNTTLRSWRTVLILSPNCMNILCNCLGIECRHYFEKQLASEKLHCADFVLNPPKITPWRKTTAMAKNHGTRPKSRYSRWSWFRDFLAALPIIAPAAVASRDPKTVKRRVKSLTFETPWTL